MAKPDLKLSIKPKDGGERIYPGAAWKSDRGDSYNFRLDDGWALLTPDGQKITFGRDGSHYADIYPKRDDDGGRRSGGGGRGRQHRDDFGGFDDDPDAALF